MIELSPIVFAPYLKSVIWGGNKICKFKGIAQPEPHIGESWEISAMPGRESIVSQGAYKGLTLNQLTERFGAELLGERVMKQYGGKFPLLVKLIDAADILSIQVHPGDDLAMKRHGCSGKAEMWYIIQADEGAKLYSGLSAELSPDTFLDRVANGTFTETLAVLDSHADDVLYLPAGRIHSIGAGNFLAEIQQASDVTYRIYDYGRRDADGNLRELHADLAKDAIDYTVYSEYKQPPLPDGVADCELVKCDHFNTRRIMLDGDMPLTVDPSSFTVIMCIEGNVELKYPGGKLSVTSCHTVLVPAVLTDMSISGKAKLLVSQV